MDGSDRRVRVAGVGGDEAPVREVEGRPPDVGRDRRQQRLAPRRPGHVGREREADHRHRQQAPHPTRPEAGDVDPPAAIVLAQEQARDQEPRQREEQGDAEEATRHQRVVLVVDEDGDERGRAEALEPGPPGVPGRGGLDVPSSGRLRSHVRLHRAAGGPRGEHPRLLPPPPPARTGLWGPVRPLLPFGRDRRRRAARPLPRPPRRVPPHHGERPGRAPRAGRHRGASPAAAAPAGARAPRPDPAHAPVHLRPEPRRRGPAQRLRAAARDHDDDRPPAPRQRAPLRRRRARARRARRPHRDRGLEGRGHDPDARGPRGVRRHRSHRLRGRLLRGPAAARRRGVPARRGPRLPPAPDPRRQRRGRAGIVRALRAARRPGRAS